MPQVVTGIIEFQRNDFRFDGIQPEITDPIIGGSRVGGIIKAFQTHPILKGIPAFVAQEETMCFHVCKIRTLLIYSRPDGDHALHAHGREFIDHGLGVRPTVGVE